MERAENGYPTDIVHHPAPSIRAGAPAVTRTGATALLRAPALLALSSVLVAAGLAAYYALRANTWAVMTDELQVARLATSIAEDFSLVPTIRGSYYAAHSQLYPLLLSPFYGTLSPPDAATAAHALNVVLLVSAAVPAYYLARAVSDSEAAGYVAAALTAVTPWLVLSSTLLTENGAYAAFAWSVLLCQRAIAHPSHGRDAAALAGVGLAFFARTQLFVLALALPAAVVLHEFAYALRGDVRASARTAVSGSFARHRVLVAAYLAGGVIALALAVAGRVGALVGNYGVPFDGDLVPSGFWSSVAAHLDQVVLGVGVLPAVLTAAWVATTIAHPMRRDSHAFAALLLVLVPVLLFEVTSFDLRFTPGRFIQDRYLVYLVPLFAVGSASWLVMRTHLRTRAIASLCAGAAIVALLSLTPDERKVIFWASPAAAFRPALADAAGGLRLGETLFLQLAAAAAVLAVVLLSWRAPRVAVATTASALVVFGAAQALYVFEQFVAPSMVREQKGQRDWIDGVVPDGASVALVPSGGTPVPWWEAEFWNRRVDRVLQVAGADTFSPFPALETSVDPMSGRLLGEQPSDYLVVAAGETRFGLAARTMAVEPPLRLLRAERPYRLRWTSQGLTGDGWLLPGEPVTVRVYGGTAPERRAVRLTLASSRFAARRFDFAVSVAGDTQRWSVDPGGARPPVDVTVCIPAGGHADIRVLSRGRARLQHGRIVSLHLERLAISRPWPCMAS